jgi:hypothetical protein
MTTPLKPTIICLRISSVLYFLIAIVCVLPFFTITLGDESSADAMILRITWGSMCVLSLVFGIFIEFIIKALKCGQYWGWIAGLCLAGLYIPSGFMVLGIIMLINLLKEESKEYCKKKESNM